MPKFEKHYKYFYLLFFLVLIDVCFLILAFLHKYTIYFNDWRFFMAYDWSYGEIFKYSKELTVLIIFLMVGFNKKLWKYLFWSGVFLYIFLDDAFQIHERIGNVIAGALGFETLYGIRAQDFGELSVFGSFGAFFFIIGIMVYLRLDGFHKKIWKNLFLLMVLLVVCGIGFDILNELFDDSAISIGMFRIGTLFGALEDFGEMVVLSFFVWYSTVVYKTKLELNFN